MKKAESFANWAMGKVEPVIGSIEYEGKRYTSQEKIYRGRLGKGASGIISEIGAGRVYLINTEQHILWIENAARYVGEYGKIAVGETKFIEETRKEITPNFIGNTCP